MANTLDTANAGANAGIRYTSDLHTHLAGAFASPTRPDAFASLPVRVSCGVRSVATDTGARLHLVMDETLADYAAALIEAASS